MKACCFLHQIRSDATRRPHAAHTLTQVRALFVVAALLSPAVIFIDEIDSLLSARKAEGEHEASRRLKTELLVQMEGCGAGEERVLIIGASNRPEELDEAARRRLPKQLYIPLPCADARRWMVTRAVGPPLDTAADADAARGRTAGAAGVRAALSSADLEKVVAKTEGYSGSDMRNLLQEACQGPVRDAVRAAAAAGGGGAAGVAALREADLRPVALRDFAAAARAQRASVEAGEVARYEEYNARHGARFADEEGARGGAGGEEDDDDGW
jgi:SpoVK/Ycf46/Vps4 family AAA+-type ATPase